MKVEKKEVEYVAALARIELSEQEKEIYSEQLSEILEFFDRLKEVDTEQAVPTAHVLDLVNAFRPDELCSSLEVNEALGNAPDHLDRFYQVPKILE